MRTSWESIGGVDHHAVSESQPGEDLSGPKFRRVGSDHFHALVYLRQSKLQIDTLMRNEQK